MVWNTLQTPVAGTVITVAWATANVINSQNHLRAMTGNADPPGSGYVVRSTSTTATAWGKVASDHLAQPLGGNVLLSNNTGLYGRNTGGGDYLLAMVNNLNAILFGEQTATTHYRGGTSSSLFGRLMDPDAGSSTPTGQAGALAWYSGSGRVADSNKLGGSTIVQLDARWAQLAGAIFTGNVVIAGFRGLYGRLSGGGDSVLARMLATDRAEFGAAAVPTDVVGAATSTLFGRFVGTNSAGAVAAYDGNVRVNDSNKLEGQTLAQVIASAAAVAGGVPVGLVAMVRTAAEIPSGWSRETNLDGRIPVGAGTTFSVTFTEANNYGTSWAHTHPAGTYAWGQTSGTISGSLGGSTSNDNAVNLPHGGSDSIALGNHGHSTASLSAIVAGSISGASGSTDHVPPSRAYVYMRKN